MGSYLKYFLKRVFFMLITLWLIATITFFLMQLLPGTPYTNQERLSPETIAMLNKQVGLDKPVIVQYGIYLSNLVQGNFGISFQFKNQAVAALLAGRIGPSLQLGLQAIVFGTFVGINLGNDFRDETKLMGRYGIYFSRDFRSLDSQLCFCRFATIHFCYEITYLADRKMGRVCLHHITDIGISDVAFS